MSEKPSIPEVAPRFAAYYRDNPVWGSLHIVLDDGNVEDSSVDYCIQWATDSGDKEGLALALILRQMSKTQRRKLPHVIRDPDPQPARLGGTAH
jgi:hypothetical protein